LSTKYYKSGTSGGSLKSLFPGAFPSPYTVYITQRRAHSLNIRYTFCALSGKATVS